MIRNNIFFIKEKIAAACLRVNRDPKTVDLLAVTKQKNIEQIKEAVSCGITQIGENKVQEALSKYKLLSAESLKWHLIGHLQTNKAKEAVRIFDLIHSVDSCRLAEEINKQAVRINKVQNILVEVNVSGEDSKFGMAPQEVFKLVKDIDKLPNLRLLGLMTMAPIVDISEKTRPYFRKLKELFNSINAARNSLSAMHILSMGMSDDYEIAVEEGATVVRIGRVLFR